MAFGQTNHPESLCGDFGATTLKGWWSFVMRRGKRTDQDEVFLVTTCLSLVAPGAHGH